MGGEMCRTEVAIVELGTSVGYAEPLNICSAVDMLGNAVLLLGQKEVCVFHGVVQMPPT